MMLKEIKEEDLFALRSFTERIDRLMERYCSQMEQSTTYFTEVDKWGHKDLTGYLPWMGPRYAFAGHPIPMSVFRAEGMALFLLIRMLCPEIAVECYTGTGYAAAWMAAGGPTSIVYTVDNYQEGDVGSEGHFRARRLLRDLGLSNAIMLQGTVEELYVHLWGRRPSVYFSDGPLVGQQIDLAPDVVVIRHDNLEGQAVGRSFFIRGGSNLSVMCPSVAERKELMSAMARYFPVERCDA